MSSPAHPLQDLVSVEDIQSLHFFSEFPTSVIRQVRSRCRIQHLNPKEVFLKEGDLNTEMTFLLSGQFGVYVRGEKVAELSRRGDMLGEMSILSAKPASATLIAEKSTHVLSIGLGELFEAAASSHFDCESLVYKVCANILADKLLQTNEKARRFEIANRELLKAQANLEETNRLLEVKVAERTRDLSAKNTELQLSLMERDAQKEGITASLKKMEELYHTQELTLQRVSAFSRESLEPLKLAVEKANETAHSEEIRVALKRIEDFGSSLASLSDHLKQGGSVLRSRRVLLADSQKKQQVVAKMALGGTGVQLEVASTIEEAIQKLSSEQYDLVFSDAGLIDLFPTFQVTQKQARFVLMGSDNMGELIPKLNQYPDIHQIVTRNDLDRTFTVKNISTTATKLISSDIFGLEKYLAWGAVLHEVEVRKSSDREIYKNQMVEYFESIGIRSSVIDRCFFVAEELLMNAIYDAPKGPDGKSKYNHIARTQHFELPPLERSRFRFGCDGILVGISVRDPFGGLKPSTVLRYIESCLSGQAGTLQNAERKAGAGMGLFQLISSADLVVFNVDQNRSTEVVALFAADPRALVEGRSSSFHFFFLSNK